MEDLERYIRDHRSTYTREALTRKLLDAGNDPAEVSAAWSRVDADDASVGSPQPPEGPPPAAAPVQWPADEGGPHPPRRGVGGGTTLLLIALILAYGGAILASFLAFGYNPPVFGLYIVAMIAAGIWSGRRMARASSRDEGVAAIGVALAISVGLFVGLGGLCIVGLSTTPTTIFG